MQTCRKVQYNYRYIDLASFFPYISKAFEAQTLKFIKRDVRWSNYILEGFRTYGDQTPHTWAVDKESTIIAYFTEPEDKQVDFLCRPFNPPGQPLQESEIFINGTFLTKITFPDLGRYEFHIPGHLLQYGSNRLVFKWKYVRSPNDFGLNRDKRNFVMGFANLTFQGSSDVGKKRKKMSKIVLQSERNKTAAILVPQAGVVEYAVVIPPLPLQTRLQFELSSVEAHLGDSEVHVAVYGEKSGNTIMHFKPMQFEVANPHVLDLRQFAGETVKIVFANSIRNHPNFTVSLREAGVYTTSGEGLPLFKGETKPTARQRGNKENKFPKAGQAPNVFIYLIDTLRADHVSCYGYKRETTPFIDRFAKEGILVKNCFAAASWTKPAVGSILTGLYPNKHRAEDNTDKLSLEVETLAEILKAHGYATIHITPNVNTSKEVNFDQGVDHYLFSRGGKNIPYFYYSSEYVNSEFKEILETNPHLSEKPLFAFLHTVDPHDPYTPAEPFLKFKKADPGREGLGLPDNIRIKKATTGFSPEDIDYIEALYDCEILHNDHYFGKFLELLKEKKLYDNSIIILVADHGEQFDEHGGLFHGSSIYNEEIHVPLIFMFPGGEGGGKTIENMVSQVDIYPTILDYLGIAIPANVDGMSILGEGRGDRRLYVREKLNRDEEHKNNFVGILFPDTHLKTIITYENKYFIKAAKIEGYDLVQDFAEQRDSLLNASISRLKGIKFQADYFLERMESFGIKKSGKLDLETLDPEKLKQLKALGYIN